MPGQIHQDLIEGSESKLDVDAPPPTRARVALVAALRGCDHAQGAGAVRPGHPALGPGNDEPQAPLGLEDAAGATTGPMDSEIVGDVPLTPEEAADSVDIEMISDTGWVWELPVFALPGGGGGGGSGPQPIPDDSGGAIEDPVVQPGPGGGGGGGTDPGAPGGGGYNPVGGGGRPVATGQLEAAHAANLKIIESDSISTRRIKRVREAMNYSIDAVGGEWTLRDTRRLRRWQRNIVGRTHPRGSNPEANGEMNTAGVLTGRTRRRIGKHLRGAHGLSPRTRLTRYERRWARQHNRARLAELRARKWALNRLRKRLGLKKHQKLNLERMVKRVAVFQRGKPMRMALPNGKLGAGTLGRLLKSMKAGRRIEKAAKRRQKRYERAEFKAVAARVSSTQPGSSLPAEVAETLYASDASAGTSSTRDEAEVSTAVRLAGGYD